MSNSPKHIGDPGKKRGRRAYVGLYKKNSNGDYEYSGEYVSFEGSMDEYKKKLAILWVTGLGAFAAYVFAGCLTPPGMNAGPLLIIPCAAAILFGVSIVWALCRTPQKECRIKKYVFKATIGALSGRVLGALIFAALSVAAALFCAVISGIEGKMAQVLLFLGAEIIGILLNFFMRKTLKAMKWL